MRRNAYYRFDTDSAPEEGAGALVPCFAISSAPVEYGDYLTLAPSYRDKRKVTLNFPPRNKRPRTMFVGQSRDDLAHLPSNPKQWHPIFYEQLHETFRLEFDL